MTGKIAKHIIVWIFMSILVLMAGRTPGLITIHESGNAAYVWGSHCMIYTEVSHTEFAALTDWCVKLHK